MKKYIIVTVLVLVAGIAQAQPLRVVVPKAPSVSEIQGLLPQPAAPVRVVPVSRPVTIVVVETPPPPPVVAVRVCLPSPGIIIGAIIDSAFGRHGHNRVARNNYRRR